tara:strand:+ start:1213 stop:1353 length:141 start_codon:yes stop_codon:yes gene_type:complete
MNKGDFELEKWKEENCECGLTKDFIWSEELFEEWGCNCEEEYKPNE